MKAKELNSKISYEIINKFIRQEKTLGRYSRTGTTDTCHSDRAHRTTERGSDQASDPTTRTGYPHGNCNTTTVLHRTPHSTPHRCTWQTQTRPLQPRAARWRAVRVRCDVSSLRTSGEV